MEQEQVKGRFTMSVIETERKTKKWEVVIDAKYENHLY